MKGDRPAERVRRQRARSVGAAAVTTESSPDLVATLPGDQRVPLVDESVRVTDPLPTDGSPLSVGFDGDYAPDPPVTFTRTGTGRIDLTGLSLRLDPKKADGGSLWPGGRDVPCAKNPGQETPLTTFEISAPTPTPAGSQRFDFTLEGETFVKSPNGRAPLSGSVGADLDLDTGAVGADLDLSPRA